MLFAIVALILTARQLAAFTSSLASAVVGRCHLGGWPPQATTVGASAALDLGCAKTPAVAPHVEISPGNCIPESQIMLHTRGSMPCWRIVFSTFCGCMSFYTGSIRDLTSRKSCCKTHSRVSFTDRSFDTFSRLVGGHSVRVAYGIAQQILAGAFITDAGCSTG
jgi:hypothetical protein